MTSLFPKLFAGFVTIAVPVYLTINIIPDHINPLPDPHGVSKPVEYRDIDIGEGKFTFNLEANTSVTTHFIGEVNEIKIVSSRGTFSAFKLNNVPISNCSDYVVVRRQNDANSFRLLSCANSANLSIEGVDTSKPVYDNRSISPGEVATASLSENTTVNINLADGANHVVVRALRGSFNAFRSNGSQMTMFCSTGQDFDGTAPSQLLIRPCNGNAKIEIVGSYKLPRQPQPAVVVNSVQSVPTTQYQSVPQRPYYQERFPHVISRPGVGW